MLIKTVPSRRLTQRQTEFSSLTDSDIIELRSRRPPLNRGCWHTGLSSYESEIRATHATRTVAALKRLTAMKWNRLGNK